MADTLRVLLESTSTLLADVGRTGRVLVRSDRSGSMQLYLVDIEGEMRQCTALPEPVGVARSVPGTHLAVIGVDAGGNERYQLYVVDLDAEPPVSSLGALRALTRSPEHGHHLAGVSPSGDEVAYLSNRRNGIDFDLWVCDLAGGEPQMVYAEGGYCLPSSGYSPDGRYVAVQRPGPRPLDTDLVLVDVRAGTWHVPLPHAGEAAQVGNPAWVDGATFYASSTVGRDRAAIVRHTLTTGATVPLAGAGEEWDGSVVSSGDGKTLLVIENANGASRMRLFDTGSGAELGPVPTAEPGVVDWYLSAPPQLSGDGFRLVYWLSTPRRPGDVWEYERGPGTSRQLTWNPGAVDPATLAGPEAATVESFDGEQVPLFTFRPAPGDAGAGPVAGAGVPVVVVVHGGPESQSVQSFSPVVQALVAEGFAVVVPNVRGSTGYGKRYASLDDTTRRLDSVRDLASVHAWLAGAGFDPSRAALWGGSYGGYMVLAGLAFQPDRWAAGVDIVGISDLVTFLEHTSDYRRAHREREYGSLAHDRAFLERASPLRRAADITAPLFVIHGRNDPRVPVTEAEQLVAAVSARGVRSELVVYEDEGHGLARLANRVDGYGRAIRFLREVLWPVAGDASSPAPEG